MHTSYRLFTVFVIMLIPGTAWTGSADEIAVPVHEEYRHRLVFEKDHVRIMSVNIPPGDTSGFHIHEDPTVYIVISPVLMSSQSKGGEWQEPDPALQRSNGDLVDASGYRDKPLVHRVFNPSDRPFRVIGIMNSGPGQGAPTEEERHMHARDEINNEWFASRKFTLAAGTNTEILQPAYPAVVIQTGPGHSDVLIGDISTAEKTVSGNWSWHNAGVPFRLRNLGDEQVQLVIVEVR